MIVKPHILFERIVLEVPLPASPKETLIACPDACLVTLLILRSGGTRALEDSRNGSH